jgi:hypothetical protein
LAIFSVAPGGAAPASTAWPAGSVAHTSACQNASRTACPWNVLVCAAVDVGPGVPVKSAVVQLR